jgi:hypothetical protein
VPHVLIVQPLRTVRQVWRDAFVRAGHEVVAADSIRDACLMMWARDFDAIIVATPPEAQLAELLDATPGPWAPPIVLVGAPYSESIGVPRAFAAARCAPSPTAARLVATLHELLVGADVAVPAVPHGRADVPLRLPPERVLKWRSWLAA